MLSDYYCKDCRTFFEYDKPYGEEKFPDNPPCPSCQGLKTRRKITFNSIVPNDFKSVNSK